MATKKTNILILWDDDIGWWNISFNNRGQMGYRTPNINRVANEGVACAPLETVIDGRSRRLTDRTREASPLRFM
jgi:hypothetical protein